MLSALKNAHATYRFLARHPLTKNHRMSAMGRYTRWQIVSRLWKRKRVVPFIGATKLSIGRSMTGATGNVYAGLHEFRDMAFVLHVLRPCDTFFDVGANVGTYTVLAAGVAGASVVCFEPVDKTFSHLTDNVRLNDLENRVRPVRTAVGRERGTVRFTDDRDTVNHVVTAGEGGVDVPVCPLDDYADQLPFAMKVDVEGFEDVVLAGADRLLRSTSLQAILIEANQSSGRYGKSDQGVHESLLAYGFTLCDYDPRRRLLTAVDAGRPDHEENGLYVRDLAIVQERLRTAAPFVVLGRSI